MFGRDDLVGRKLDGGRYELLSLIGRGGTSQVYAAKQRSVDRMVAIKIIHRHLVDDQSVRLREPARIQARHTHGGPPSRWIQHRNQSSGYTGAVA